MTWGIHSGPSAARSAARTTSMGIARPSCHVVVRIRPLAEGERKGRIASEEVSDAGSRCLFLEEGSGTVKFRVSESDACVSKHTFAYDGVLGEDSTQQELFDSIGITLGHVLEGHNGCILAYGQTGAGKTHSLLGNGNDEDERGIVSRVLEKLCSEKESDPRNVVSVSVVELYCEKLRDLIDPSKDNLTIKTSPEKGVMMSGVTEIHLDSRAHAMEIIENASRNRSVSSTAMNSQSSRSHLIIFLKLRLHHKGRIRSGKLGLLDLAGSERQQKAGTEGKQLEEAIQINKSLSALGGAIFALIDEKASHVRFRDSKLTRLLQDCLEGNAYTSLIICCSPAAMHAQETLSTLRFGARAKMIECKIPLDADGDQTFRSTNEAVASLLQRVTRLEQSFCERESIREGSSPFQAESAIPTWKRRLSYAFLLEIASVLLGWSILRVGGLPISC